MFVTVKDVILASRDVAKKELADISSARTLVDMLGAVLVLTSLVEVSVVNVPAAGVVPPIVASTVPALMSAVVATNEVSVPTAVIADCVAPVTVAAVPDALPVTFPVSGPAKFVSAVITPPSMALLPTSIDPNPDVIEPESSAPTVTALASVVIAA